MEEQLQSHNSQRLSEKLIQTQAQPWSKKKKKNRLDFNSSLTTL